MGTGLEDEAHSSPKQSPKQDMSLVNSDPLASPSSSGVKSESEYNADSDDSVEIVAPSPASNPVPPPDPLIVENFDENLPKTVSLLTSREGAKVYLIGTAHFSLESMDDVSKVVRNVRPHIVVVELCRDRANILQMDEKTLEQEAKNITFEKIVATIKENGVFHGLMYTLFLNLSANLTKELGMAPGGEFRRALAEVRMLPNCVIHFGDRPIQVTLKRALSFLSWWQCARLVWRLLFDKSVTTLEEVEKCKQKDMLEQMLKEMTGEFPELARVFVDERNTYLAYSLELATYHQPRRHPTDQGPVRVVGIVGMGHVDGISQQFGTVQDSDIPPLMLIPPPSRSGRVVKATIKLAFVSLAVYGAYKLLAPTVVSEAVANVPKRVKRIWNQVDSYQFLLDRWHCT